MTEVAFDSSTMLTWVLQEYRWRTVDRIISQCQTVYLPGPALTEVIYRARARGNTSSSRQIALAIEAQGLVCEPADRGDLVRAAELFESSVENPGPVNPRSGRPSSLSLADSLILAVVERLGCPVISRDTYWMTLAEKNLLGVRVVTF